MEINLEDAKDIWGNIGITAGLCSDYCNMPKTQKQKYWEPGQIEEAIVDWHTPYIVEVAQLLSFWIKHLLLEFWGAYGDGRPSRAHWYVLCSSLW